MGELDERGGSGILHLHFLTLLKVSALQLRQGVICIIRIRRAGFLEVFLDAFTCAFLCFLVREYHSVRVIAQYLKGCTFSVIKVVRASKVRDERNACLVCTSVASELTLSGLDAVGNGEPLSTLSLTSPHARRVVLISVRSSRKASMDFVFRCNLSRDSTLS